MIGRRVLAVIAKFDAVEQLQLSGAIKLYLNAFRGLSLRLAAGFALEAI